MEKQIELIKRLRKYVNMTQSEFSHYTEIPLNTIKGWESGKTKAPDYVLKLLEASILAEQANNDDKTRRLMAYFESFKQEE